MTQLAHHARFGEQLLVRLRIGTRKMRASLSPLDAANGDPAPDRPRSGLPGLTRGLSRNVRSCRPWCSPLVYWFSLHSNDILAFFAHLVIGLDFSPSIPRETIISETSVFRRSLCGQVIAPSGPTDPQQPSPRPFPFLRTTAAAWPNSAASRRKAASLRSITQQPGSTGQSFASASLRAGWNRHPPLAIRFNKRSWRQRLSSTRTPSGLQAVTIPQQDAPYRLRKSSNAGLPAPILKSKQPSGVSTR